MAGRIQYKILKNMPFYNAYSQYYYNEDDNLDFLDGSGINTTFKSDDLYTRITDEGYVNASDSDSMPDWRPITEVFIGNPTDINNSANIFLQRYYEFGSSDYIRTSAPNVVSLIVTLAENNNAFNITPIDNPYAAGGGEIGIRVLNWDWSEGEYEFLNDFVSDDADIDENYVNLFDEEPFLMHQYDSPGLKTIKATVYAREIDNKIRYKHIEIKIFLGLDGVFVEDFIDIGGPDFTYLPWPQTTPIIGGVSKESDYYQSVKSIVNSNMFGEKEKFERFFAEKAFHNDQLGDSLGDSDIEQVRAFKGGGTDMNYMLGIVGELTLNGFNPYYENGIGQYWDGEPLTGNTFPRETSVGTLFIDESEDQQLINNCLFELNCGNVNVSNIIDTCGNGNKGILIGDYKITKEDVDIKARRDTVINIPKTDTKNGAL
tara:strand:- start:388 stop:1677 length:1290 start_codon:yes stop_codon:yes gene_type:complete